MNTHSELLSIRSRLEALKSNPDMAEIKVVGRVKHAPLVDLQSVEDWMNDLILTFEIVHAVPTSSDLLAMEGDRKAEYAREVA